MNKPFYIICFVLIGVMLSQSQATAQNNNPLVSHPKSSAIYFGNLNSYAATRMLCLK